MTLTDEENIRQRLLEIRKTKLKRERVAEVVTALTEKFEKETDELGERNRAKEEEQKTLLTRKASHNLTHYHFYVRAHLDQNHCNLID